jgi:cytochrome c-type biogenesis protein CcmH/NrfG
VTGVIVAALALGVPALAFTLWPLLRRDGDRGPWSRPADERAELLERKRTALAALRELDFEHDAGHLSHDDYADLRARYENEAARVLAALDRLGPPPPGTGARIEPAPSGRPAWRHPVAAGVAAVLLVGFGVGLGAGIVQHSTPDLNPATPMAGSRPLADLSPPSPSAGAGEPTVSRAVTPEVLQGMLRAARASLFEGRQREATAAYQAVLKRDPQNVDALTHLGLILALNAQGNEHDELIDHALRLFDRALAIDATYSPALLYRGQVLYEAKHDVAGALASWEQFLTVTPSGADRDRVAKMIAEAKRPTRSRPR